MVRGRSSLRLVSTRLMSTAGYMPRQVSPTRALSLVAQPWLTRHLLLLAARDSREWRVRLPPPAADACPLGRRGVAQAARGVGEGPSV
eukprot:CAMPEP_0113253068 /NCGR_PEP_ID=MMETSP0008_2-20120614/12970_1 /TAXON_ID=97485 /ORGANISM="Prymnesium parvum" /LENGTH=87 /DNA_ID=CAMNT_0000101193 /DNA_START=1 /DNA_END=261 /DNA_ORIENTATION=- /assembly_acc=CAM_ASM_000153